MGQSISRRVMPHLSRAIEKREKVMAKEALDDIALRKAQQTAARNKYIDPSAAGPGGFRRDQWTEEELSPQERQQKDFLRLSSLNPSSGSGTDEEKPHEMPEDLIQFLNDAGPLERRVNKDLTSPRVYNALKEEEKREDLRKDMQRRKRVMPMIENDGRADVGHDESQMDGIKTEMDGTTVSRTTNFSVTPVKKDDKTEIRLENGELYQLLSRLQSRETSAEKFVRDQFKQNDATESGASGDSDPLEPSFTQRRNTEYINIVKNVATFNEIPTLMQDTDGSLVGAWSDQVDALKLLNVRMAPNNVKICLDPDDDLFTASVAKKDRNDSREKSVRREQPMTTAEFLRRAKSNAE